LKREDQVRRRIGELEKTEKELKAFEARRQELLDQRKAARLEIAALAEKIFELRVHEVDQINREFGDVVLLTLRRGTQSKQYISKLSNLLSGSRVRTQETVADDLASKLSPAGLLELIEMGDAQKIAVTIDRDLGQITRVVTYLRDHPDLYHLEDEPFDDVLEITMFDRGQPKQIESLSEGQRATALLPLILRTASCPLIVDQPEDDLDNSFIFQVLVKNVVRLKSQRQLIFVTHNANIPVLGDAEKIIVMSMEKPNKAAHPTVGSLEECKDHILELLEGGKEAFEKREHRYGLAARHDGRN
jgi:ATPase subunit of ABC transporter with duplicated ATPase domains